MTDTKAEAMTPIWVCNLQNNLVDTAWFGRENVFDTVDGCEWRTSPNKVSFPQCKTWQDYVRAKRLEIACGEAPYLSSRYDVLTGMEVDLRSRVGILDRKLRVVNENADNEQEWLKWATAAMGAVYGYEIRPDKVKLAQKNLELTFVENYQMKFGRIPGSEVLEKVRQILQENIVWYDALDMDREIFQDLKFDAAVGNPPYHMAGGAGGSNDAPVYQKFVERALGLDVRYVSMVIPARWFAGGRENLLGDFRKQMLSAAGLRELIVYTEASEVFDWVRLSGGICCFLAEQDYAGKCRYDLVDKGRRSSIWRKFDNEILIRDTELESIVEKVVARADLLGLGRVSEIISGNTPFGITSDLRDKNDNALKLFIEKSAKHNIALYFFDKPYRVMRYIDEKYISKNQDLINKYKVILPAAGGTGNDKNIIGKPQLIPPMSVCSQTYLCVAFDGEEEAQNFLKYVRTRFFRALVGAAKVSQSAAKRVYRFVPLEDSSESSEVDWSGSVQDVERQLYERYRLNEAEIGYIEGKIADWGGSDLV